MRGIEKGLGLVIPAIGGRLPGMERNQATQTDKTYDGSGLSQQLGEPDGARTGCHESKVSNLCNKREFAVAIRNLFWCHS